MLTINLISNLLSHLQQGSHLQQLRWAASSCIRKHDNFKLQYLFILTTWCNLTQCYGQWLGDYLVSILSGFQSHFGGNWELLEPHGVGVTMRLTHWKLDFPDTDVSKGYHTQWQPHINDLTRTNNVTFQKESVDDFAVCFYSNNNNNLSCKWKGLCPPLLKNCLSLFT